MDTNEAGEIAARRAIQPLRSASCKRRKWRFLDQRAIAQRHPIGDLDRGSVIGKPIDRFKLLDGRDNRHRCFSRQAARCLLYYSLGLRIKGSPARTRSDSAILLQNSKLPGASTMMVEPCSNQPSSSPFLTSTSQGNTVGPCVCA